MSDQPTPPIVIAVVSWNTRELLLGCLRALEQPVAAGVAEVWVVDNGSTDGSAEAAERTFAWVKLLRPERNLGFGSAVNLVAESSESEWIAPANADTAPQPGAIERMLATASSDDRVGCVAPRLVLDDGSTQHSVHAFPSFRVTATEALGLPRIVPGLGNALCLPGYWQSDMAREIDWAHGALLLIRRDAFDAIGGFDRSQWMYAEDLDLCWRLRARGWLIRYEPDAHVGHRHAAATEQAFGPAVLARQYVATYRWIRNRRGRAFTLAFGLANWASCLSRSLALWPQQPFRQSVAHRRARLGDYGRLHLRACLQRLPSA